MTENLRNRRFRIVVIALGIFSLIILFQFGFIMLGGDGIGIDSQISLPPVERGPILDRNGRILAIQTKLNSVSAWVPNVTQPEETSKILGEILNIPEEQILEKFKTNTGFLFIKRKISPTENSRILSHLTEGRLEGISLVPEFGRNYPAKSIASHVIGYVGVDNIGLDGLEYTFNQELTPPVIGNSQEMVYGNQLFLTIDLAIQQAVEKIAEDTYTEQKASSVMILVAEAKTGDILAYASLPNYDPNILASLNPATMKNKPISLLYEPGSVFKVFSMASLLELGLVREEDTFFCNGYYEKLAPDGKTVRINCLGRHGNVTIRDILKYSCNAGAAYASDKASSESFYRMLKLFGFGETTGIPLNGEEPGTLRPPRNWSIRSKPTIAIGQEVAVTAIQMVKAATALANEGVLLQPHIVKKLLTPDGRLIKEYPREPVYQVISPHTARQILQYMASVTEVGGTATRAQIPGVRVSAKTGTAQMMDPQTGKYSDTAFIASCLALFPTESPQVIVYVVVEGPKGDSYFGGRVAAPLIQKVGEFLVPYLGIPREGEQVYSHPGILTVPRVTLPPLKDTVPDFTGLPKKVLLPLLSRKDVKVILRGSGWVYRQTPPPGTPIKTGMEIILELR
ncbi:MAG: penicillin-binding transpeptidase domain-containing protein [Spirochaetes bacterium]|nr:penicillin-binding transpeptidase domain-containing protein [Spirochaetota bacterium]